MLIKEALIKGSKFYDIGEYVEALSYFDEVLSIDPNNETARANKAVTIASMGKYSSTERERSHEELSYLDKALSINPNNSSAWGEKGMVLLALGRDTESYDCLSRARELGSIEYYNT